MKLVRFGNAGLDRSGLVDKDGTLGTCLLWSRTSPEMRFYRFHSRGSERSIARYC